MKGYMQYYILNFFNIINKLYNMINIKENLKLKN